MKLAGDLRKHGLRKTEFLGEQFSEAVSEVLLGAVQVALDAFERVEMALARTECGAGGAPTGDRPKLLAQVIKTTAKLRREVQKIRFWQVSFRLQIDFVDYP